MVGLSEALSFPFAVECFEVPAATFRRFDELWQKSGLKAFANASKAYLQSLIWSLHARACHGRSHKNLGANDQKAGERPITCQLANIHISTGHHQSDGGSTTNLLRHSTAPHPESHDNRCRVSGVQESQDPTTIHDSCVQTPHARDSRSQCASICLIRLRALALSNIQAESSRMRHEIVQDLQGFPLANEPVPSSLIKRLQSIVSG